MNQAESGRSLIEMLAVIGIIGVLSVGVISTVRWGLVSGGAFSLQADVESAAQQLQELCSWNDDWPDCQYQCPDNNCDIDKPASLKLEKTGENADGILTAENVPVRVCRRLLNPTYTNWSKDLIEEITTSAYTSSIPIPLPENKWQDACGKSSFGKPVTMKFHVLK